jgi:hypothetical protein
MNMPKGASGIQFKDVHVYSETESLDKIVDVFGKVMKRYHGAGDDKEQQELEAEVRKLLKPEVMDPPQPPPKEKKKVPPWMKQKGDEDGGADIEGEAGDAGGEE